MTDARELLEQYAAANLDSAGPPTLGELVPAAFAALRRVLDKCDQMETDNLGDRSLVGMAIGAEFRNVVASALTPKEEQ